MRVDTRRLELTVLGMLLERLLDGLRHLRVERVCATTAHSEYSSTESCTERYSSQFQNNRLAEMWSDSEEGSYLRLVDCCITQLKA